MLLPIYHTIFPFSVYSNLCIPMRRGRQSRERKTVDDVILAKSMTNPLLNPPYQNKYHYPTNHIDHIPRIAG